MINNPIEGLPELAKNLKILKSNYKPSDESLSDLLDNGKKCKYLIEKHSYFISENRQDKEKIIKILFDKKDNYEESYSSLIDNLKIIEGFLKSSENEEAEIYLKLLNQYREGLIRLDKKIDIDNLDEDEYSEEITSKFLLVIERDYLRLIFSALKGERVKKLPYYSQIREKLEEYLDKLGFYKKDLGIEEGKELNENCYEYMSLFKAGTEDMAQDKKIKEIELESYFLKYINDDGEEQEYSTKGKITVYVLKENK